MKKDLGKYLFAVLLFGSNGIVASHIGLSSYEIVLWRTLTGSVLLLGLFAASRRRFTFCQHKRDLLFIALSGVAMGGSWIFLYEAYAQLGVSLASLAYYCGPVLVMVLSPLVFRERLTAAKLLGFAAVVIGIALVNGKASGAISRWGLFCGLASAALYAVMVILNKKAAAIQGLENATLQLVVSFFIVAIFVGLKTGFRMQVASGDWPWILLLGVLNTGLGCYCYFSSIGWLPAQTVAICGYLEPLSAVLLAMLLLGESMTLPQALGALLIIGGALFGECYRAKGPQRQPHALA